MAGGSRGSGRPSENACAGRESSTSASGLKPRKKHNSYNMPVYPGALPDCRQPVPEHHRETEEANVPLEIDQYFEKMYAPLSILRSLARRVGRGKRDAFRG